MKVIPKKFLLGFVLLLILVGGYFLVSFKRFYTKTFVPQQFTTQAQDKNKNLTLDKTFNVLLLGYPGVGDRNIEGDAYLTDSMIVIHNDPKLRTLYLISIPRDIWVAIPTNLVKNTFWKINAAYELGLDDQSFPNKPDQFKGPNGGANMAKYVVSQVTGLSIDRFVGMDFNAFKKTIDSLGGVDINVNVSFDDFEYPIEGKEDDLCGRPASDLPELEKIATISATQAFPCRYEHLHFDQGQIRMNGETALKYVRSRHSLQDGSDFGRSRRQRNLLLAFKQKVFSLNAIPSVIPLMNSLENDFKTDFSLDEIQTLLPRLVEGKSYTFQNIALTDQNVLMPSVSSDGQFILVPKDGSENWDGVHAWLESGLAQSPSQSTITNSSPIIKVENGTYIAGLAALAVNRLQDKDLNILSPVTAADQSVETTTIFTDGSNIEPKLIAELKDEFGVDKISTKSLSDQGCNILIIVGKDYNRMEGKKLINE